MSEVTLSASAALFTASPRTAVEQALPLPLRNVWCGESGVSVILPVRSHCILYIRDVSDRGKRRSSPGATANPLSDHECDPTLQFVLLLTPAALAAVGLSEGVASVVAATLIEAHAAALLAISPARVAVVSSSLLSSTSTATTPVLSRHRVELAVDDAPGIPGSGATARQQLLQVLLAADGTFLAGFSCDGFSCDGAARVSAFPGQPASVSANGRMRSEGTCCILSCSGWHGMPSHGCTVGAQALLGAAGATTAAGNGSSCCVFGDTGLGSGMVAQVALNAQGGLERAALLVIGGSLIYLGLLLLWKRTEGTQCRRRLPGGDKGKVAVSQQTPTVAEQQEEEMRREAVERSR
jgi:hypothetical protein